jgi:hypothetical protein
MAKILNWSTPEELAKLEAKGWREVHREERPAEGRVIVRLSWLGFNVVTHRSLPL